MSAQKAIDPIILALVQNRLDHIAQQMGRVMVRTARSPIFSQAHDSPASSLTRGHRGQPGRRHPDPYRRRRFRRPRHRRAFRWRDRAGDVFLLNDPYAAGGNHLPDWVIARPVFVGDDHLGFACNRAHHPISAAARRAPTIRRPPRSSTKACACR